MGWGWHPPLCGCGRGGEDRNRAAPCWQRLGLGLGHGARPGRRRLRRLLLLSL